MTTIAKPINKKQNQKLQKYDTSIKNRKLKYALQWFLVKRKRSYWDTLDSKWRDYRGLFIHTQIKNNNENIQFYTDYCLKFHDKHFKHMIKTV